MPSVYNEILAGDMMPRLHGTFHGASMMLDRCSRRVVGGIELLGWHSTDVNWETADFIEMAKFIMKQTSGKFSFSTHQVKFEDEKDAVIFKLWYR